MRALRKVLDKEKIFYIFSRIVLLAFTALICLWMISGARAAGSQLKEIKIQEGDATTPARVEFTFSQEMDKESVTMDFQRNFIQLSFRGAQIYPARTRSAKGSSVDKVFGYQYQPDLARARLMLKGEASTHKDTALLAVNGAKVTVTVKNATTTAATSDEVKTAAAAMEKDAAVDKAEEKIVQEILSGTKTKTSATTAIQTAATAMKTETTLPKDELLFQNQKKEASEPIAKDKPVSPAKRIASALFTVLLIMSALALGYRRFVLGKGVRASMQDKMISTVATHMLAPKKSIAVIRVAGQHLVIAISGDNITLLTTLAAGSELDKYMDTDDFAGSGFDTVLEKNMKEDGAMGGTGASSKDSLRDSIRRRVESFKPLSRA